EYKDINPLIVGVLKGVFIFMGDLAKYLKIDCEFDFMAASSYGKKAKSDGVVFIEKNVTIPVKNRDVILVEDIIDSGSTLDKLKRMLIDEGAKSVRICTLLNKPSRRTIDVDVDYIGYEIEDAFIVGYGLDYDEKYRNLPYIGFLNPEIYENN
ncbi:MAG: hypoxanthine phosphoribosyltransferase, partial [Clostridia bacterium]|nr:hypoxanthine phosphoribosyltransferase [Clostridia bacterium]